MFSQGFLEPPQVNRHTARFLHLSQRFIRVNQPPVSLLKTGFSRLQQNEGAP